MSQTAVEQVAMVMVAFFCAGLAMLCFNKAAVVKKEYNAITLRLIGGLAALVLLSIALSA